MTKENSANTDARSTHTPSKRITIRRILPIVKKEFRQISRDRRSLGVLLVIPAFMLVMFGYALSYDVKHVKLAVLDQDITPTSRDFYQNFLHSEFFDLTRVVTNQKQIDTLMERAEVRAVLVIPPTFSTDLTRTGTAKVQIIVDGANAVSASTTIGYLGAITQAYSTKITLEAISRAGIARPTSPIDFRPRIWYNPELKSAKFLVPGLIGFILMITTVVSTSLSLVREKEKGTMEQIVVSPIHPLELFIGKIAPYVIISMISTCAILITGYLLFDVVVKGSLTLLFVVSLLFTIAGLGIGLFVSTVTETQESAFMLAVTVAFLPTFMLSGFTFPIRNMPMVVQGITYVNPARYYLSAIRGIILKGVGIEYIWPDVLALLLFITFISFVTWNKLRKQ